MADVRRLDDAFAAIDFFEHRSIPHVVAINQFDGAPMHGHEEIREALAVRDSVPLLMCDARRRESSKRVLVTLVEHAVTQLRMNPDAAYAAPEPAPRTSAPSTTAPERTDRTTTMDTTGRTVKPRARRPPRPASLFRLTHLISTA